MLFNINIGNKYTVKYNNLTGLFTLNGQPLQIDTQYEMRDFKNIKIVLGHACNSRCKYCLQPSHDPTDTPSKEQYEKFKLALDTTLDEGNFKTITFYGGEPLLYWDYIVDIVESFKHKIKDFGMLSNGIAMTMDKVKFMEKNNIGINMSHDGPGQWLRGIDPLAETAPSRKPLYELYKSGSSFSLSPTITSYNYDLIKILEHYDNIGFYNCKVNHSKPTMATVPGSKTNEFIITEKEYDRYYDSQIEAVNKYGIQRFVNYINMISAVIKNHKNAVAGKPYNIKNKCIATRKQIRSVDLFGNSYICHNSHLDHEVFPGVKNIKENIITKENYNYQPITTWLDRNDECKKCVAALLCLGGCPIRSLDMQNASCTGNHAFYTASLMITFGQMFKSDIQVTPSEE